jgi:hypothetical protein
MGNFYCPALTILVVSASHLSAQQPPITSGSRFPATAVSRSSAATTAQPRSKPSWDNRSLLLQRPPRPDPQLASQGAPPWIQNARQRLAECRSALQAAAAESRTNFATMREISQAGPERASAPGSTASLPRRPATTSTGSPRFQTVRSTATNTASAARPVRSTVARRQKRAAATPSTLGVAGSRYPAPQREPRPSPFPAAKKPAGP